MERRVEWGKTHIGYRNAAPVVHCSPHPRSTLTHTPHTPPLLHSVRSRTSARSFTCQHPDRLTTTVHQQQHCLSNLGTALRVSLCSHLAVRY